eukprot:1785277-Amphidinium_carterae.1
MPVLQFGVVSKKAKVERSQASDAVHDELRYSHIERLQLSKPKKRKVRQAFKHHSKQRCGSWSKHVSGMCLRRASVDSFVLDAMNKTDAHGLIEKETVSISVQELTQILIFYHI